MIFKQAVSKRSWIKTVLVFLALYGFTLMAHAGSKPLWTPEDVVTQPWIGVEGISNDGKHTLISVKYTALKEKEAKEYSECIVINNNDLKQAKVGGPGHSCQQSELIGEGRAFSYLIQEKDKLILFVRDILSEKTHRIQELKKEGFSGYHFAPNGKRFVFMQQENSKKSSRRIVDEEQMIKEEAFIQEVTQDFQPIGKPQLLPFSAFKKPSSFLSIYGWSPDSQNIAFNISKPRPKGKSGSEEYLYLYNINQKKTEKIDKIKGQLSHIRFSSDGQKIAYLNKQIAEEQEEPLLSLQKDKSIEIINLKTKEKSSLIIDGIRGIIGWIEGDQKLLVHKQDRINFSLSSLDIETKALTCLEKQTVFCPNQFSLSQNAKYIAFEKESFHYPTEVYASSVNPFKPKKVTSIFKGLNLSQLQVHPLTWKSFDGLEIEGILIYPQNYQKGQKVPLVVSVHGGPHGSNFEIFVGVKWGIAHPPAVFASLGYATLQVNYRGSTGYGKKFQSLGERDLGGGDFQDIMAGVDFLIEKGIADPDQLFISGHSYGGYMVAWAIGQTNRFKAAIMEAGITDWISDYATTDASDSKDALGEVYWENYDLWRERSALTYVNQITTPLLILHGVNDDRVHFSQAQQFYQALKGEGVPTRLVYYYGEEHGFDNPLATIDAIKETINWFKAYGKGQ